MSAFDELETFYNQLDDHPLEPDDAFYEDFYERQPEHDPIQQLATQILWSKAASVNLLSGQRGSGKSTELRRLRKKLTDKGCVVLLCDMRDYLNLTQPLEITDFFISLMVSVNLEAQVVLGKDFGKKSYWDRLITFLNQEVKIGDLKLEGNIGGGKIGISASLKDDPTFKARLQEHLRGHVFKVVKQAHDFAMEIVQWIRDEVGDPNQKVVLLIDSMEQIRGVGKQASEVYQSVENLFSAHADKLDIPLLHVVYTIPPYLTTLAPNLGRILGGNSACNLPSVHIRDRAGTPDPTGLAIMRSILHRRYPSYQEIFPDSQVDRMALVTGGDFRNFFRLLRDALVKASGTLALPVPDRIVTDAENHLLRDMLPIAEDDREWLKKIGESKAPKLPSDSELSRLARFFDTHLVLNYRNGEDWYDVHPLLRREIGL